MKRSLVFNILVSLAFLVLVAGNPGGKGAFYTGKYRNLFLENGHSKKEIKARNEQAYRQLFHGDSATRAVVFKAGNNENGPIMDEKGMMSLASTHPLAKDFVEAQWKTPLPSEFNERYYDGLLYMMGILNCSGEFRIWNPR